MAKSGQPTRTVGFDDEDYTRPELVGIDLGRSQVMMVPVADLEVDRDVQRDHVDYRKIEKIKREYNEDSLGIVTVSRRKTPNGTVRAMIILDGQHRHIVVKELTDNRGLILCRVFDGLTPQEESWIFLQLNAGNQPNLLDKFRQRLRAEEPIAVAIDAITRQYGLVVEAGGATGQIQCVGALQKVYQMQVKSHYEDLLGLTLRAVTQAWGKDNQGTQAVMVEGTALFLNKHGERVDFDYFVDKLRTYKGGALGLHTNARANAATRGSRMPHSVADLLTDWYNKGGKRTKLPVWAAR